MVFPEGEMRERVKVLRSEYQFSVGVGVSLWFGSPKNTRTS